MILWKKIISRILIVHIILFFNISVNAQNTIDTANLRCQYQLTYQKDTLTGKTKDDLLLLEIGKNSSKCYSYYTFQADSILQLPNWHEVMKKILHKAFSTKKIGKFPHKRLRTFVYKNYPQEKMTVTDGISLENFIYIDDFKPQHWRISDSTQTVLSYVCQKATCRYRGRNYIAWFTPEIPVSDGPWKFFGLPGLILKVYDTKKQYDFTIVGIEKVNAPIIFSPSTSKNKKYSKTTLKKMLKAKKRYLMNTGGYVEAETGISLEKNSKVMRYDLMERDEK